MERKWDDLETGEYKRKSRFFKEMDPVGPKVKYREKFKKNLTKSKKTSVRGQEIKKYKRKEENTYKSTPWRPIEIRRSIAVEGIFPNDSPHVHKRV